MSDYDIGKAFEKIENELIASMIRNLSRHRAEESKLGIEWSQWQAEQLKALEVYKRKNSKRFTVQYNSINEHIRRALNDSYNDGGTKQERQILQAIKRGFKGKGKNKPAFTGAAETTGEFFKTNERKLNSLIKATTHDMEKAEIAVLRMANDQYRKVIFNAQVMANTGAGTYAKAVDMATKDFLSAGINCIQYRNGRRVNIKSYAEMALRTANKRAYLQGEGAKRKEWGIYTVILNKRGNPCPLCAPFVGRVFIDDVWSGGPKNGISPVTGVKYPLLSEAIKKGLYHPNCRDAHTTYFEGISTPPENSQYTADELDELAERYNNAQKQNYAQNETERMERMSKFSLDKDNKRAYGARAEQWKKKAEELEKTVENSDDNDIIEIGDGLFKKDGSDPMFDAFGSAESSNPEELEKLLKDLSNMGVEINANSGGALAYQSTQFGKPGVISVTPNASYSAYLHEAQHAKDDMEAGWNGSRAVWDVDEHIRREQNAYAIEIKLAEDLGRPDIADELRTNLKNEIAEIKKRDEKYAKLFNDD